jgi:hypothetical protein
VTRPDVAAQRRGSRVAVWASWNGATEVAAWELLGGDSQDDLVALASEPRLGFETTLSAPRSRYMAVRALDASGNVLGTSRTITP